MTARTNNGEEQTTAENRQRRRTGNGEEQATARARANTEILAAPE
jgi:hypothetical protein